MDNSSSPKNVKTVNKAMKLYFIVIALTAFALAFTNDVFSNYFKDAYNVTALQRGLIEFPRESPGALVMVMVFLLAYFKLSDVKISMVAQILSFIGIMFLALTTPSYSVMLIFVFINSLGMHLFMPMQDSIGMNIAEEGNVGKRMGQYKGTYTAFQMIGAGVVFVGFRYLGFSFKTETKIPFIIAGVMFVIIFLILLYLNKAMHIEGKHPEKIPFVFRKRYKFYYILVVLFGVQKQMVMVYGPWVIIDLLEKDTATIAILGILGSFAGIFFLPFLGRMIDKFGVKNMLYADALSFILVYLFYGILCMGYVEGFLARVGIPMYMAFLVFILDRMSSQMGIIRTVYLKTIAVAQTDISPTLALGTSMDHVISISVAMLSGLVWQSFGPQYIFFAASGMSLFNLLIAYKVKLD